MAGPWSFSRKYSYLDELFAAAVVEVAQKMSILGDAGAHIPKARHSGAKARKKWKKQRSSGRAN